MFRDNKKSELNVKNFGAGSTVEAGHDKYLVFAIDSKTVGLIDARTFEQVCGSTIVFDPNFLTSAEARNLIEITVGKKLSYTFSDFSLIPKGLKLL
jgi:hypothetical protein